MNAGLGGGQHGFHPGAVRVIWNQPQQILPGSDGALGVVLAVELHHADVEQGVSMPRVILQCAIELLQSAVRISGVEVGGAQVGADIGIGRVLVQGAIVVADGGAPEIDF